MNNPKLRIWDEKYREWEELPLLAYPLEKICKQGRAIDFSIGINDSDGKEIFGGDLLEIQGLGVGRVFYENSSAAFKVSFVSGPAALFSQLNNLTKKIVGNIHQTYTPKWQRTPLPSPSQTPKLRP